MSISSLIMDIADDSAGRATLAQLAEDSRVTLGPQQGNRYALVLDAPMLGEDIEFYEQLARKPGVRLVTLVQAFLDDQPVPAGVGFAHL